MRYLQLFKNKKVLFIISGVAVALITTLVLLLLPGKENKNDKDNKEKPVVSEEDTPPLVLDTTLIGDPKDDPQNEEIEEEEPEEEEPEIEIERPDMVVETGRSQGIDVSKWQGKIDWQKVKKAGIQFAFIRIGYRGENGIIYRDETADYNMQQARKAGILIGTYFFSTAVSKAEAEEEARWTLKAIEGYEISYPVVYDCEGYKKASSRMYGITVDARTEYALAFLKIIADAGYDAMFYGSRNDMESGDYWDMSQIDDKYKVWVAHYPTVTYPQKDKPDYAFRSHAWQYTDKGKVDGISGNVDLVVCYFTKGQAGAKNPNAVPDEGGTKVPAGQDIVSGNTFTAISDKVTAKEYVNLRQLPTTNSTVIGKLERGTYLERTATSNKGWSRLLYNGQVVYAVTSYLTTEEVQEPVPPEEEEPQEKEDGFEAVDEQVTAKELTNLRTGPSTEGTEVVYALPHGEYVRRIGVHSNGWSKLEYNGQIVYAISSYLQ